jgi:hypothetical protein
MSDTAIPANLASAAEFDARLKKTDEDRWLSSRYALPRQRETLVAVYLLHQELLRAAGMSQPMLGKIRIQWWRETLDGIAAGGAARHHDLAEELARTIGPVPALLKAAQDLLDRYDDIIDDHLHAGGHVADGQHAERHLAAEGQLVRLAALVLDPAANEAALGNVELCGRWHLALSAELPDAEAMWAAARGAARGVPAQLWPAIAHVGLAASPGPLARRWTMFRRVLLRRL